MLVFKLYFHQFVSSNKKERHPELYPLNMRKYSFIMFYNLRKYYWCPQNVKYFAFQDDIHFFEYETFSFASLKVLSHPFLQ